MVNKSEGVNIIERFVLDARLHCGLQMINCGETKRIGFIGAKNVILNIKDAQVLLRHHLMTLMSILHLGKLLLGKEISKDAINEE